MGGQKALKYGHEPFTVLFLAGITALAGWNIHTMQANHLDICPFRLCSSDDLIRQCGAVAFFSRAGKQHQNFSQLIFPVIGYPLPTKFCLYHNGHDFSEFGFIF